jgi:signal transduction histidine kinase
MAQELARERPVFLSTLPAGRADRRLALAVVLASAAIFLAAALFAKIPLPQVWAFVPIYESALVVNDLITAVLLFGQYGILPSRSLLVLASGYVFTAFMAVAHALTFPGAFSPTGLLGAGPQSTAWLYMFWHGGFPLFVVGYALLENTGGEGTPNGDPPHSDASAAILSSVVAVFVGACGLTFLATASRALPGIMEGSHYTAAMIAVVSGVWALSLVALGVLWRRRPHSVLDLWLMVVMCAWLFDIALAAVLNAGRFDLGFYAGRIYGLLAASFVLVMLLLENSTLYSAVVEARESERRAAHDTLTKHEKRLRLLHAVDQAIIAQESPQAIAGAAIQPLRELLGVPRAIVNIFDLEAGTVEWLAAAGRHRTHVGPGVRYSIRLMGDVEALKRGQPQVIDTHALPPGPETDALLASGVHVYMVVPMIAGGELFGALSFGGEQAAFPPEQVDIASEAAAQLAIALAQARLLERVTRQAEELELRVRERTSELQAANRELEAFSYSVSHDLRAPLRAIDGFARILEEDYAARLDAEARRLLGAVRAGSRQMGRLIDDLLAFSRYGRQPLKTTAVPLVELVNHTIDELRSGFEGRRIDFSVGELGTAEADPALLKQVLVNLLGNAIKFSRDRDPAVVEIGLTSQAGDAHVYYVKDNGAGFDPRYAHKLFGVFQRLHGSDEFEGTGVGLAIVQRIVVRHGGRVWAESRPGEGATFYFTLGPAAVPAPAAPGG